MSNASENNKLFAEGDLVYHEEKDAFGIIMYEIDTLKQHGYKLEKVYSKPHEQSYDHAQWYSGNLRHAKNSEVKEYERLILQHG